MASGDGAPQVPRGSETTLGPPRTEHRPRCPEEAGETGTGPALAPPISDISQSASTMGGCGRSLTASAGQSSQEPTVGAGKADETVLVVGDVENKSETRCEKVPHVSENGDNLVEVNVINTVRSFPGEKQCSVSCNGHVKSGKTTPVLFRPYSDHLKKRTDQPTKADERGDSESSKLQQNRASSLDISKDSDAGGGQAVTTSDICGAAAKAAAAGDTNAISGAADKPAGCCRTRPVDLTWGRYREWYRRWKEQQRQQQQQQTVPTASDVTAAGRGLNGDVTGGRSRRSDVMISIGTASPFSSPSAGGTPESAAPVRTVGEQGRNPQANPIVPRTAVGGKLVGIAKARQREPEHSLQQQQQQQQQTTVLTSIAGRIGLPGLAGGGVWATTAGRDMGVASWGMGGASAPGHAHLPHPPSVWLGHTPQYTAAPLYTGYPQSYQLHNDPNTGHWMLVPRAAEPVPRPTVLWSPYQCLPPLQQPQMTVMPSQQPPQVTVLPPAPPPQLFIQPAPPEPAMLTPTGGNHQTTLKKEDPVTSRLKPIQPAPAPQPAHSTAHAQTPLPVQYIIPAAPLQSVYYTHTEQPTPFIIQQPPQPPPPQQPPITAAIHAAVPANGAAVQHMTAVTQMPMMSHMPVLAAPEPAATSPRTSTVESPAELCPPSREVYTRSQGTSPLNPDEGGYPHGPESSQSGSCDPAAEQTSQESNQSTLDMGQLGPDANQSAIEADQAEAEVDESSVEAGESMPVIDQLEIAGDQSPPEGELISQAVNQSEHAVSPSQAVSGSPASVQENHHSRDTSTSPRSPERAATPPAENTTSTKCVVASDAPEQRRESTLAVDNSERRESTLAVDSERCESTLAVDDSDLESSSRSPMLVIHEESGDSRTGDSATAARGSQTEPRSDSSPEPAETRRESDTSDVSEVVTQDDDDAAGGDEPDVMETVAVTTAPASPLSVLAGLAAALPPLTPSPSSPHSPAESAVRKSSVESATRLSSFESGRLSSADSARFSSVESARLSSLEEVDSPASVQNGLHLLCEGLAVQQMLSENSLNSLITAVQLLVPAGTPSSAAVPEMAPSSLDALCQVAGEELARTRVFYIPPRWEYTVQLPVDPAGRRDYVSRESAERAREWLRRRAAGPTTPADEMQVSFTIEPFWEDSPKIREIRSKLVEIQRLYKAQVKLQRTTSPRKRSDSPGKRRPSVRGARRSNSTRGGGNTTPRVRSPPTAEVFAPVTSPRVPPVSLPVSQESESDSEDDEMYQREGGENVLWEDKACADTVSYSFPGCQDDRYTNGIRMLAECKRRRIPQMADPDTGTSDVEHVSNRKKRKQCPPKKHSFSPDDTETIVAKKKCHPMLKPKLKPMLKPELRPDRSEFKDEVFTDEEGGEGENLRFGADVGRSHDVDAYGSYGATSSPSSTQQGNKRSFSGESGSPPAKKRPQQVVVQKPRSLSREPATYQSTNPPADSCDSTETPKSAEKVVEQEPVAVETESRLEVSTPAEQTIDVPATAAPLNPRLCAADLHVGVDLLVLSAGLFYRAHVEPIKPPDLYSVSIEGERNHRPVIYTQEQLLNQAVREVRPASFSSLTPGTRVTANWSPKLRGLFPGTVTEGAEPVEGMLYVEFDDGDSGYMRLEGIRLLPHDYPTVVHDQDPLDALQKRRRRASSGASGASSQRANSRLSGLDERVVEKPGEVWWRITDHWVDDAEERRERGRMKSKEGAGGGEASTVKCANGNAISNGKAESIHNGDSEVLPKKKKKKKSGDSTNGDARDSENKQRLEKRKKSADRHSSESYTVEQESDLKIRIKSPSPTRRQDSGHESTSPVRIKSTDGTKRRKKSTEPRQRHSSGMAAFLPERQLWDWHGKGVRRAASKGKAKRTIYTAISRGRELISVGDCAVFLSAGLPDRPYVGRIHAFWQTTSGQMLVQVAWFYHPEETVGMTEALKESRGALFESAHMDDNDVQTISHGCRVLSLAEYLRRRDSAGDNEAFYRAGAYDPARQILHFTDGVLLE